MVRKRKIKEKGSMMKHKTETQKQKTVFLIMVYSIFLVLLTGCGKAQQEVLLLGQSDLSESGEAQQETGQTAEYGSETDNRQAAEICVYVCGAVKTAGVVFLPEGSRAADALEAAGGFSQEAAQEAVNLAEKLTDGQQLFFPTQEEQKELEQKEAEAASGLVDINHAGQEELCTLPGIGASRAADIIAYRDSVGKFTVCEDIMQVNGIKESVYNKIKDKITVKQ